MFCYGIWNMLHQEGAKNAQYQVDALEVAPQRPVNSHGRVQRMAAARQDPESKGCSHGARGRCP
jgi:hypothetical protein